MKCNSAFISVVSHKDDQLIIDNNVLGELAKQHEVVLKNNTKPSQELIDYCYKYAINLIDKDCGLGFGANNNYLYTYCRDDLGMNEDDYFLVLNPDVIVSPESVNLLLERVSLEQWDMATIDLYLDKGKTIPDLSIKRFPSFTAPFRLLFSKARNDAYDKLSIRKPISVDWASGSFLLFKASAYSKLGGFDENYFMYFEDVDLCRRANAEGIKIMYDPEVSAVHLTSYQNRNIFSKNFLWYLRSYLRYHFI